MKLAAFLLALLAPMPAIAQTCAQAGTHNFVRKASLPAGAAAALGFPMAERGARWQVTDVIAPGPRLPGTRFIVARQTGCRLAIRYERGGIAHTYHTALLDWRGNRWALLRRD